MRTKDSIAFEMRYTAFLSDGQGCKAAYERAEAWYCRENNCRKYKKYAVFRAVISRRRRLIRSKRRKKNMSQSIFSEIFSVEGHLPKIFEFRDISEALAPIKSLEVTDLGREADAQKFLLRSVHPHDFYLAGLRLGTLYLSAIPVCNAAYW